MGESRAVINIASAPRIVTGSTEIRLLGGSDVHFATASFDPVRGVFVLASHGSSPHWLLVGNPYARVTINGATQIERTFISNVNPGVYSQSTPARIGDTIVVFHHEGSSRLRKFDGFTNEELWRSNAQNQTFVLTEFGLALQGQTHEQIYANYLARFNAFIEHLYNTIPPHLRYDTNAFADLRAMAIASAELLTPQDREHFENNNRWLFGIAPTPLPGDVNNDGVVDIDDLILLRQYLAAACRTTFLRNNPSFNLVNADVNGNGTINAADATLLRRMLVAGGN